jgi:hypothetical protein
MAYSIETALAVSIPEGTDTLVLTLANTADTGEVRVSADKGDAIYVFTVSGGTFGGITVIGNAEGLLASVNLGYLSSGTEIRAYSPNDVAQVSVVAVRNE